MLKVFLVEDETVIREGLRDRIPWEQYGYRFVGEAADGEVALPLIRKTRPDVLITDIKMPFMDGLELSRLVKKTLPRTRIIVLSGYNEFEYAKEAIKIGISDYLLKPVSSAGLIDALKKAADEIMELLLAVNRRGNTVLLVTHEQRYADLCGRKIEISDGKI